MKGHQLISIGTRDTILVEVTSVFRGALIAAAAAIILAHNHPSNDAEPSSADIKVTRELARAGEILKIQLLDHIIIGSGERPFRSLRALGVF